MPTERKAEAIEELKQLMEDCSIAISTDYSGLDVSEISAFRTVLRENGVKFKVVKNTLLKIAADEKEWPEINELIDGPTGIAFGYGEEQVPAKVISDFIRDSGIEIELKAALIGNQSLDPSQIKELASLPGKDELVSKLVGQLYGQLAGLVYTLNSPLVGTARVLNGPITGLVTVLNGRTQQG
ncbi:MAG: 50S ribosomal protein L10 [Chloroflexota bacterium]|nr:50S ribosomal protein L10 [Chloroflexota bacterium]|tara:strand:+ start:12371 stop:12919 length:549 start_codon:yes stop_codon:yes gene_type:complete